MKSDVKVAALPKPVMIFDGDCHFCTLWIKRWRQETGERVEYIRFQDPQVAERFPELSRERLATAVHLVECDGTVYYGAEAVFRALATNPGRRRWLGMYRNYDWFADASEWAYRLIAEHRTLSSWLTRLGWGQHVERPEYFLVRAIFLRAMGIIYLIAFVSLWTQISGLIGHDGILPAQQTMSAIESQARTQGWGVERFWAVPTFCWFNASDSSLNFQCAAGALLSVLVIIGVAPAPCLFLLWAIYLSLASVCQDFLGFQWDYLLLETGLLAIFLAPLRLLPSWACRRSRRREEAEASEGGGPSASLPRRLLFNEAPPSRLVLWLLRWLLFRLMFESGCVKLLSGDPMWRHLTALTVHYETQPLPTWIGWWADQLPVWFQKTSCAVMFAIELAVPFLIFTPRRPRFVGCVILIFFQLLIILTGNYTFFNWLTIALCLLLLDDFALRRIISFGRKEKEPVSPALPRSSLAWPGFVTVPVAVVALSITLFQFAAIFGVRSPLFHPAAMLDEWLSPARSFNNYGLFAVMTNPRMEIIVEGSDDGQTWRPYEFKYKPGALNRRPAFVAPHQPRLDWQMWFAALGNYQQNPWFVIFCERLLQGSPDVLALLEKNPFPGKPPRYIRALLYEYHFTTPAGRRKTGDWWTREYKGEYLPAISLRDFERQ